MMSERLRSGAVSSRALTTLVIAASIASAVPAAPAPGLVAAYAFSAGAGAAAADSSGTGNNGSLLNASGYPRVGSAKD